jgi:transposase
MENIKRIFSKIWVDDYLIKFEYDTKRKNHKEQTRLITQINKEAAERDFIIWMDVNNSDKPYRAMLNAQILSITKTNGRYITLKDNGTYIEA